jgi:hypothetical protein
MTSVPRTEIFRAAIGSDGGGMKSSSLMLFPLSDAMTTEKNKLIIKSESESFIISLYKIKKS